MESALEVESTLTDRYQTTVPEAVRRALRLGKRDKIQYTILAGGEVVLRRAPQENESDPLLSGFLDFLARDMAAHPERLMPVDPLLVQRAHALVEGVQIDLDATLSGDDDE